MPTCVQSQFTQTAVDHGPWGQQPCNFPCFKYIHPTVDGQHAVSWELGWLKHIVTLLTHGNPWDSFPFNNVCWTLSINKIEQSLWQEHPRHHGSTVVKSLNLSSMDFSSSLSCNSASCRRNSKHNQDFMLSQTQSAFVAFNLKIKLNKYQNDSTICYQ